MRFLVSTDGTARSLEVLPHAGRLAGTVGAEVVLGRVLDPHNDATHIVALKRSEAVAQVAAEWMEEMRAALAAAGVVGEARVIERGRAEDVHDALLRYGQDEGVDLFALDSHGYAALKHAILGSVTMGLLGKTSRPVLTAGPECAPPPPDDGQYRVLLTVDGSAASLSAVRAVRPLVEAGPVHVTLLRIYQPAPKDRGRAAEMEAAEANIREVAEFLPGTETPIVREIAPGGGLDTTILEVAAEAGVDAIAIATQGHSALRHVFLGSVANGVLKRSTLPLILARQG